MIAAVLCGGKGTRLRAEIGEHQKCAVDVGGRPWIHHVLDVLQEAGVEQTILLTGYQHEEIEAAAAAWDRIGDKQGRPFLMGTWLMDTKPTSTEAAIQYAFAKTGAKALLVMNGDTLVEDFNFPFFLAECEGRKRSITVRGTPAVGGHESADAGIYFRALGTAPVTWPVLHTFLDIGTPEGLAEARRRFAK